MANIMRWRYGDTNPIFLAVDPVTDIEIGDLLWVWGMQVKPASELIIGAASDSEAILAGQTAFHSLFVGVAMTRSRVDDLQPVRVATGGVYEFDTPIAAFELGDRIGLAPGSDSVLADQRVVRVPNDAANRAIGQVAKRVSPAGFLVLFEIHSTLRGAPS